MFDATTLKTDGNLVPCLEKSVPATLCLNGKFNPPIEAEGEIINLGLNSIQIRCNQKIPIPSHGKIQFSLGNGELELQVEFVQRFELTQSFWSWKRQPKFEIRVALGNNSKEKIHHYQDQIHQMIFRNQPYDWSIISE